MELVRFAEGRIHEKWQFATNAAIPSNIAARIFRRYWDGRLPVSPQRIAESMGIEVCEAEFTQRDVVSMARCSDTGKGKIVLNESNETISQNFAIAHSLGHFLLAHFVQRYVQEGGGSEFLFETNRTLFCSSCWDQKERSANRFAEALLMPRLLILDSVLRAGVTDVRELVRLFGVSRQAMIRRLVKLGLV